MKIYEVEVCLKPIVGVLSQWDRGVIHGIAWLDAHGMGRVQVHRACRSGELRRIGSGVFVRPLDILEWPAAVEALQSEFKFPVHVGGLSALELLGAAHQLRLNRKEIDLISYRNRNLPRWVTENEWGVKFRYHRSALFKSGNFLQEQVEGGFHLLVSSRETAILEYIDSIEFERSFESLENVMMGLRTMRSDHLQLLLEGCGSLKVKRIFLYLSEKLEMSYFSRLDLRRIDLGKDFREIIKGGKRNSKYRITVPREEEGSEF